MTLRIVQSTTPTRANWLSIWQRSDAATYFHSPAWCEIWLKYKGSHARPAAQLVEFSDGMTALLPLCVEPKGLGMLTRRVSSFEATYGGWISADPLTLEHAQLLTEWLTARSQGSLVWRVNPYDPLALQSVAALGMECRADETHAVALTGPAEVLLKGFKKGCREDIRKAQKRPDLEVAVARTQAEWRAYYRVYLDALDRWGERPENGYDWSLFESFAEQPESDVQLWITRERGAIVSGELVLFAKKQAVSWHAATVRESLKSAVAKFQTFKILDHCFSRGLSYLDFNPSAGLGGVAALKESFRPRALPAPVVYVDSPIKHAVRGVCARFNIGYARLDLVPAATLLTERTATPSEPRPAEQQDRVLRASAN